MRRETTLETLLAFMTKLGEQATSPGVVYLVGGACSVFFKIRPQTLDIDIKLDPEPGQVFQAIAQIKQDLQLNIELASPDMFVPALSGWKERSIHIQTIRNVEFKHYDFYTQALAKIDRGHPADIMDLEYYFSARLVEYNKLFELFLEAKEQFLKYPAVDFEKLREKVLKFKVN